MDGEDDGNGREKRKEQDDEQMIDGMEGCVSSLTDVVRIRIRLSCDSRTSVQLLSAPPNHPLQVHCLLKETGSPENDRGMSGSDGTRAMTAERMSSCRAEKMGIPHSCRHL